MCNTDKESYEHVDNTFLDHFYNFEIMNAVELKRGFFFTFLHFSLIFSPIFTCNMDMESYGYVDHASSVHFVILKK